MQAFTTSTSLYRTPGIDKQHFRDLGHFTRRGRALLGEQDPNAAEELRADLQREAEEFGSILAPKNSIFARTIGLKSRVSVLSGGKRIPLAMAGEKQLFFGDLLTPVDLSTDSPDWDDIERIIWHYATAALRGVRIVSLEPLRVEPNDSILHLGRKGLDGVRSVPATALKSVGPATIYHMSLPSSVAERSR